MSNDLTVIPSNRQVIENKLLTAIDDDSKVAILASREDLDLLIEALSNWTEKARLYSADLSQLRRAAFGDST